MADIAHEKTDKILEQMEKRLSAIYSRASKEVKEKADNYFKEFRKQDEKKRKLLADGKITEADYKSWRKRKIMTGRRYIELKEQLSTQLLHVNETATAYVNNQLPEIYALNYNSFDAGKIAGYSFNLVDANTVKYLSETYHDLLPYRAIDAAKDVIWNKAKINSEILQGILQGENMDSIAQRLVKVTGSNYSSAIRNARTAVTGAENKGRLDSYERAQDDGLKVKKRWMATLDSRTRHAHGMLDGKTAEIDEPFKTEEFGDIMFPGDPTAKPANIYNCRCTMVADVGQRKGKTRVARDESGNSIVIENMTYSEWIEWKEKNKL